MNWQLLYITWYNLILLAYWTYGALRARLITVEAISLFIPWVLAVPLIVAVHDGFTHPEDPSTKS